jgi:outer membrane protein
MFNVKSSMFKKLIMNISKIKNQFFLLFCIILNCQLSIVNCFAQSKFGHVDYTSIISIMQGIDSIQILMTGYVADLQTIGEQMEKEIDDKQSAYENMEKSGNTSQAILKIKQEELMALYKRIEEFKHSANVDIQEKQKELLEPFQTKLHEAIKKVAKAESYNYIFDSSNLIFYAPTHDLTNQVKAELGIK